MENHHRQVQLLSGERFSDEATAANTDGSIMEQSCAFGPGAGLRRFRCRDESRRPGDCDVVLPQSTYQRIVDHLASDTTKEQGGLILGYEIYSPDGTRSTVFIVHSIAAPYTDGTPTRLTFPEETWAEFDRITDQIGQQGLGLRRVGWYHSHPNISIFLSHWDLDVCSVFTRPTHLALVVDPVKHQGGFFVRGHDGFRQNNPQGFWELSDVQQGTVVTWKNMIEVTDKAWPVIPGLAPAELSPMTVESFPNEADQSRPTAVPVPPISVPQDDEAGVLQRSSDVPSAAGPSVIPAMTWAKPNGHGHSPYMIPPWAFILVSVVLPVLMVWVCLGSFRAGQDALERSIAQRLEVQEKDLQDQVARIEVVSAGAEKIAGKTTSLEIQLAGEWQRVSVQTSDMKKHLGELSTTLIKTREELAGTSDRTRSVEVALAQRVAEDLKPLQDRTVALEKNLAQISATLTETKSNLAAGLEKVENRTASTEAAIAQRFAAEVKPLGEKLAAADKSLGQFSTVLTQTKDQLTSALDKVERRTASTEQAMRAQLTTDLKLLQERIAAIEKDLETWRRVGPLLRTLDWLTSPLRAPEHRTGTDSEESDAGRISDLRSNATNRSRVGRKEEDCLLPGNKRLGTMIMVGIGNIETAS